MTREEIQDKYRVAEENGATRSSLIKDLHEAGYDGVASIRLITSFNLFPYRMLMDILTRKKKEMDLI